MNNEPNGNLAASIEQRFWSKDEHGEAEEVTALRAQVAALTARVEAADRLADSISDWACVSCDVEEFKDADPDDCCEDCGPVVRALAAYRATATTEPTHE